MEGLIFDIQRSSLVDGEGIRTTVFFKGCNLRCKWCHNPEGLLAKPQLLFYADRCRECKMCHPVCKKGAGECTLCGECALICPNDAKEICGKYYTVEQICDIIDKDTDLYRISGGGVTFSGGECMLQIDFLERVLKECHQRGVNTAVDTAGNVPFEYFERILPYVDTFLYDIKCVSRDLHIHGTGVDNTLILENLDRLLKRGAKAWVRVPVVGGFNDTEYEMDKIFSFLKGKGVHRVELLPYHALGAHKYEGLSFPFCEFTPPKTEIMNKYKELFISVRFP